MQGIYTQYASR